jgi:hypothetical protein
MFSFAFAAGPADRVARVRLAAVSIVALTAAATVAGCGGSDKKVGFPAACTSPTYKPSQIIVTCADAGTVVRGITWKSYGDQTAQGSGTANVNACDPNCAAGKFSMFPAAIKLSAPKDCGKDTQFTHLVVTYTGARPATGGSSIQEDFPCSRPSS